MLINILGVIYTLELRVDGNIVDPVKYAADSFFFGSPDDHHDTHHSPFFSHPCMCYFQMSSLTLTESSLSNQKTWKQIACQNSTRQNGS